MKKVVWSAKALVIVAIVALAGLAAGTPASASQQPPASPGSTAAQEGFVPVGNLPQQEQLPAAPLVMGAYAVAWVAVFGYLWSIWRRLGSVERDILEVSRRIEAGSRR
jgi:CcmD family protein